MVRISGVCRGLNVLNSIKTCSSHTVEKHLQGKVIWITGASSGLGEHLAYELARNGSKLILSGTSEERLNEARTKCVEGQTSFRWGSRLRKRMPYEKSSSSSDLGTNIKRSVPISRRVASKQGDIVTKPNFKPHGRLFGSVSAPTAFG
ncbi:hypothetical protein AVEN_140020-1 [Araneus ventricosus]|uniref:Dehydrogenase/reductase SDR family member 7 n=1 Tax=Araneus ventricosus TaxID=182803 RepID=A0A4Y2DBU1_ARAVE|nr:hypothetical protein AVEN_140020-1 [Araneus ventricosus]